MQARSLINKYAPSVTGVAKSYAVAAFRETCKDAFAVAMAKGVGRMMTAASNCAAWML